MKLLKQTKVEPHNPFYGRILFTRFQILKPIMHRWFCGQRYTLWPVTESSYESNRTVVRYRWHNEHDAPIWKSFCNVESAEINFGCWTLVEA